MKQIIQSEAQMVQELINWVDIYYPNALVHVDFGSGTKLTKGQAVKQALLNKRRGHPDLLFYEPRKGYVGLAIEAKREGEKIYRRDGHTPKTEHIREQISYLAALDAREWYTVIGIGLTDTLSLVKRYLDGDIEPRH
jgi:hypothetical protein